MKVRPPDPGRPGSALSALFAAILLASCAPADDADALFASLSSPDLESRQEAAERIERIVESGDYQVFVRGLDSPNQLNRVQSFIELSRMSQSGARQALRAQLAVGRRMMIPYNPIRMRPASLRSDSRILVANLIQRGGGDPEAIGVLLAGAEEGQSVESLEGTCYAVGALRDPAGIPFLERASRHPDKTVVRAAVQALGQFKEQEVVPILGRLIQHAALEVRSDVLTSLATRDDQETRSILRAIGESDPEPDLRVSAYETLSRLKDPDLVPYFIARLKDAPEPARSAAAEALERLTGQALGAKPEPWERWWAKNRSATPAVR